MSTDADTSAAARRRTPRPTVRLRLTLLYGLLVLMSGALLLGLIYTLVDRATRNDPVTVVLASGATVSISFNQGNPPNTIGKPTTEQVGAGAVGPPDQAQVQQLARRQHDRRMHELLVQSSIALGITAVASIGLGWLVAGRVLRPLRTITAATRDISASNLHQRLALRGPDDELKELGDTIDGLLSRLDASFDAQRHFVANASHELRTPLARQRTLAQVAISDPEATVESLRAAHERVLAAGEQQERLIEALLTLARSQSGLIETEPVNLATIAERVTAAHTDDIATHSLRLETSLQPAWTDGDADLLERVVTNLIDNATRHNYPGGYLRIATATRDGHSTMTVSNSGPVVPDKGIEGLFQPFRRLDSHRNAHGDSLGLGLSIVQAIADIHHATIRAQPHQSGGMTMAIDLPEATRAITPGFSQSPDVLARPAPPPAQDPVAPMEQTTTSPPSV